MIDYDDSLLFNEDSPSANSIHFRQYVKPLLTLEPAPQTLPTLYGLAYDAWRLGIQMEHQHTVRFVNSIHIQLYRHNPDEFLEVLGPVLDETYDSGMKIEAAERVHFNSNQKDIVSAKAEAIIDLYRSLFESEFRLWATVPYFYACSILGAVTKPTKMADYKNVSAGTKYVTLLSKRNTSPYGDLIKLADGFDNEVRNAGGGHVDWELNDDDSILLRVHDPRSGSLKKTLLFTIKEFEQQVKECRRTLWVLKLGQVVFLNDNPDCRGLITSTRPPKAREIQLAVTEFARNYWFSVESLTLNQTRTEARLVLQHSPRQTSVTTSLFFSSGQSFDVIVCQQTAELQPHLHDILRCLLLYFEETSYPRLGLVVMDRRGESVCEVVYEPGELKKLSLENEDRAIPIPTEGAIPNLNYNMILEVTVPAGQREKHEEQLRQRGEVIIKNPNDINLDLFE